MAAAPGDPDGGRDGDPDGRPPVDDDPASGGRVVVVTGASSGIGRLAARRFASRGDRVVLAARSETALADAAGECREAGGEPLVVPADVASYEEVGELGRRTVERFGAVDVWVNGAAVMAYGEASRIPYPVHRRVIEVNLFGVLHGSLVAIDLMDRERGGVIVNVGSLYGRMTSPFVSPYVTSKFAVLGLSEVLRQELATTGIDVCTVLPGSMDTPIFRHAANHSGRRPRPVPPVGDPDRVARTIVSLAGRPRAEATVGQTHRLLAWGHRLTPTLYGKLAPYAMRRFGLGRDQVAPGEGNVFVPMPEWDRPEGAWRRTGARVGAAAGAAAAVVGTAAALLKLGRSGRR